MHRTIGLFLLVALAGAQEEETVRALRYRVLVHDSALDAVHGGGRWIDELYLPGAGVVCNVVDEPAADADGDLSLRPRMNAFFAPIRNRFAETFGGPEVEHETVEVAVPRVLAERVRALAELTRRQRELAAEAAAAARDAGVLGGG